MKAKIEKLFAADLRNKHSQQEYHWIQVRDLAVLAIVAFLLMSFANIYQFNLMILLTTLAAAGLLGLCLAKSWAEQRTPMLENGFFAVILVLFTYYVLTGGNDGFALLWVIFVPFMFMTIVDLKKGMILSIYFLLLLFLTFHGPLTGLLRYDYPGIIQFRFPLLYLTDCILSFYIVQGTVFARYNLLEAQVQIRKASFMDAATGLQNRSAYTRYVDETDPDSFIRLSVIYIDVNGLHELNNRLGHAAGDEMLRFVAEACVKQFPKAEIFRLGGDEFLILCPVGTQGEVQKWVEQLSATIEAAGYTIACGVESRMHNFDIEDMVNCADAKMLANKADYYRVRDRRKR